MKVLVVEPGMVPYEKEINGLKEMQAVVGGTITASYPFDEQVAIVSNDDALGLHMPFNRSIEGGYGGILGPFFICGLSEDSFCSLTPEQMQRYKRKYHDAEMLIGFENGEPVTLKVEPQFSKHVQSPKHRPERHNR